jgi:hypothetical protein
MVSRIGTGLLYLLYILNIKYIRIVNILDILYIVYIIYIIDFYLKHDLIRNRTFYLI